MKFAKRVFFWAGVYGLIVVTPHFFLEKKIGLDNPPAITHPEHFYGFVVLALAFQVLFLIIARDPARYRAAMVPSMIEKFGFAAAAWTLFLLGRAPAVLMVPASIDLVLGVLFLAAYLKTPAPPAS